MDMPDDSLIALFVSAFVSSTLAPGGSEALLAWLLTQAIQPPAQLWFTATLGNTLGAMTTWGMGTLLSWGWSFRRWPTGNLSDRSLHWLRRFGLPVLLFSWLPVIGDGLCLAAGWLRLPWFPGMMMIALGKGVRYGALVWWFG